MEIDITVLWVFIVARNVQSTHDFQGVCVDEDHGELDNFVVEVRGVVLLACGLKIHHADVVVVGVSGSALGSRLQQLLLLVVALQPLLHHIFHTSSQTHK